MFYNSKWFEIFWACIQLDSKNETKEAQPFFTFFHKNVTFWSAAARVFTGPKKSSLSLQMLISCNLYGGNFWNFFHIFKILSTKRSYSCIYPKLFLNYFFILVLKMVVLEPFWRKHRLHPLGVNDDNSYLHRFESSYFQN